jgi:hypothetical protein
MKNQEEVWLPIKGYEGYYEVSNLGNVKSLKRFRNGRNGSKIYMADRNLKFGIDYLGRKNVVLSLNNKTKNYRIHQLVAMAFLNHVPCGHKLVVDHIDNNPSNNNINNLQLISQRKNASKDKQVLKNKYTGVYKRRNGKYRAIIHFNKKNLHLGTFESELDAHLSYQNKLIEIHNFKNNNYE